jgi:glycosyltransferase involved in cell wall biosynthesis
MGLAKTHGAHIVANSVRLAAAWDHWHKVTRDRFLAGTAKSSRPDLLGLHVLHDPFVDEIRPSIRSRLTTEVLPATEPGVVISRMVPVKRLDLALRLGLTIITQHVDDWRIDLNGEDVLLNAPHAEAMARLSKAEFLLSTWPAETFGINAFEAAERGVPVILCEDELPHASRSFLPDWGYITCEPSAAGVRDAISRIPKEWSTLAFRKKLAKYIRNEGN